MAHRRLCGVWDVDPMTKEPASPEEIKQLGLDLLAEFQHARSFIKDIPDAAARRTLYQATDGPIHAGEWMAVNGTAPSVDHVADTLRDRWEDEWDR